MNRKKSILLIDDDDDELDIFIIALNESGVDYNCNFANSAEQAFMILKGLVPDFIFLDINMPKTNGFKCLQEIKKIKYLKETPVIIYSTGINDESRRDALTMGASACIQKPRRLKSLTETLKMVLTSSNEGDMQKNLQLMQAVAVKNFEKENSN
jgi:two-component system chemotaxis response regulator CheY